MKNFCLILFVCQIFWLEAAHKGCFQEIDTYTPTAGSGAGSASSAYSPITTAGELFAAVPNYEANNVTVYSVNQTTGAFTEISGSPFSTGTTSNPQPAWQSFSPITSNGMLFSAVANFNENTVTVYAVDQTSGSFTSPASYSTGNEPASVEFSPLVSGNLYAVVPNSADDTISVYAVNQTTGAFTLTDTKSTGTGSVPNFASFSPLLSNGKLYCVVANGNFNNVQSAYNVSVFSVNTANGKLTEVANSPFATGAASTQYPYNARFSPQFPNGKLYAAVINDNFNGSNLPNGSISVFKVDPHSGEFTLLPGTPFEAGNQPNQIAFSPLVNGSLSAAVVNYAGNNISLYHVHHKTGAFTELSCSPVATGQAPDGIAYSPLLTGGLFATTANFNDGTTWVYQVSLPR